MTAVTFPQLGVTPTTLILYSVLYKSVSWWLVLPMDNEGAAGDILVVYETPACGAHCTVTIALSTLYSSEVTPRFGSRV